MNNERRGILSMLENCIDAVINVISIFAAYTVVLLFYDPVILLTDYRTTVAIALVLVFSMPVYQSCQTYRKVPYVGSYGYVVNILKANFIIYGVALFILLFSYVDYVRGFILLWGILSFVFSTAQLLFKKRVIISVVRAVRRRNFTVRRVIIVGDNIDTANAFVKQLNELDECPMIVLGAVGRNMKENTFCDHLGDFEDLGEVLDTYKPDDVMFAIDSYNKSNLVSLVNMCDDRCVKVYFLPATYGFFKSVRQIERIGSVPVINIHSTPLDSRYNQIIKRIMDIVLSLFFIVLTSPLMLAVAIGVKLSSPGPVLFFQERIGKMGKPFKIIKFRSMYVTKEQDKTWTTPRDERKTRFGAFLRRSSLDELPQFFNVLIGNMSLVGPRPEMPHFVEQFKNEIPLYMVKHYVKPGMTGLAQIKRLRGNTSVEDRISADVSYIENWSLLLDLEILLKTPLKAYNSEEKYVALKLGDEHSDRDIAFDFASMKSGVAPSFENTVPDGEPKRVLYCASATSHIDNFHKDYIAALKACGHEVSVLSRGESADYDLPFEKKIFSLTNLRLVGAVRRIIKSTDFDVIVLNTSLAAFIVRLALPRKAPRVVNFVHGYLFSQDLGFIRSKLYYLCEKLLARRTDDVIVMNMQDYRAAIKGNLAKGRVYFVKGMGAEVRQMITRPEELRKKYSCEDKYVMTFVGELSARKNQAFLIKSMHKIKQLIPNAVLWLVGDGAMRKRLTELAREAGVEDSVVFMGARSDACDYIRASDIYVSASGIEGMPFNIIEALGCGVPVVASMVKGHVDIITPGKDGLLYYFNSAEDFATKVYKIHTKSVVIPQENMQIKYEKYTKNSVFKDTFSVLLCAMGAAVVRPEGDGDK